MNNLDRLIQKSHNASEEIFKNQKEVQEINYINSRSRKQPRLAVILPLHLIHNSMVLEFDGLTKLNKLNYNMIGRIKHSHESNIADQYKVSFANSYYYKNSSEIFFEHISTIEIYDDSGEYIWPYRIAFDFYLLDRVVCRIFDYYLRNLRDLYKYDVCRVTL